MRYALVLWDFDGTLADTLAVVLRIYNDLAPQFGRAPITDVQAIRDTTPTEFLRAQAIPLWRLAAIRNALVERMKGDMAQVRLYPDLVDVLRGLHHGGWRQGVVSSNSEENIRICLRSHAVEPCFEFVRGYSRLWGKSQALRRVLRGAALDPREVLYVGDEVRDIAAAQDVGIAVAAVTWGIHSKNLLAQHAPTHLIDYPCQLLELLENQLV